MSNPLHRSTIAEAAPYDVTAERRPAWKSVLLVLICMLAMITNIVSAVAVSSFTPVIGAALNIGEGQLPWVISAFSLSAGCFLLVFGRLADLYGRKKAFLAGTLYLAALSIGCGFAQSATALLILRGLQGLGAAAFLPAASGILANAFPPSRARSAAFASFSAGAPIGAAVGIQIGALLTQFTKASWRSPFFLMAGLAALCALGGFFFIERDTPSIETDKRVDWVGAFLVTVGLVLVVFVLSQGSIASDGWRTGYIIALLIVGIVFLLLFTAWQYYLEKNEGLHAPPLMKLSLWRRANGRFAAVQLIGFFEWAAFFTFYFWAQVYYEDYEKLSPVLAAVRLLPMSVVGGLCNVLVALIVGRISPVLLIGFGTLLTGVGALLFAVITPSMSYWAIGFPAAAVSVFGTEFMCASGTLFVAKVSLPHEQSLAAGVFQTLTNLGVAFGLAISTISFDSIAGSGREEDAPLGAYHAAQWTAFAFAMFCALLAAVFLRGVGPIGTDERKREEDTEVYGSIEKGVESPVP